MNAIVLHLMVNDVPFVGLAFATLLFLYACVKNKKDMERYSLWMFIGLSAIALIAFVTSPAVEDIIGDALGRGENNLVEIYRQAAVISFASIALLGLTTIAGVYVYRKRERYPRVFLGLILLMAGTATGLSGWAADREGRLQHAELIAVSQLAAHEDGKLFAEPLDSMERGY